MFGLTPFNRQVMQKNNSDFVDFYNMIDDFFNDSFSPVRSLRNDTFKMDVKENEKEYLIEAEVPGIKKEDIKLDYNGDKLIISIQKNEEVNEQKDNYIHRERKSSSMQRGVYLKNIKADSIDATLEEGILKIIAPKVEINENRYQIEIK
ncbi:MAG: Hsp20/alpha crystallin family protein [Clostridia bacterium]|jgi:HSP20 family protein|nr:Hsp20/alpha crystallin family protein [Clostridia bacterium]